MIPSLASFLGWSLLHALWQGALVGLAGWLALTLLPRRWVNLRYGVACALLAALVVTPVATTARQAPRTAAALPAAGALVGRGSVTGAAQAPAAPLPRLRAGLERGLDRGAPWLPLLWLPGFLLCALRVAGGGAWLTRARRAAVPVEGPWATRVLVLAKDMNLRRLVDLRSLPDLEGPVVVGILKPVILLPLSLLSSLPPDQLDMLLRHELAHVRRHDYLVNLLQRWVEALFFFHPAAWWLSARIREERELCADALATAQGRPLLLAEALTSLISLKLGCDLPDPAFAVGALDGALGERLKALLDLPRPQRHLRLALLALPLLAVAGLSLYGVRRGMASRARARAMEAKVMAEKRASGQDTLFISLWRKPDGSLAMHAPRATADQMLEAFEMGERLFREQGRMEHHHTLRPAPPTQRQHRLTLEATPQVLLETIWRLKTLPDLSLSQPEAMVVRRDNLLLPGDDPLDPPLDLWVPKAVDQFHPDMAKALRELMLEVKALPVTPGMPQERSRPIPGPILAAMKAPQLGEPQYRLHLRSQRAFLERASALEEFSPAPTLRYSLDGLELGPVPGITSARWQATEAPEEPVAPSRPRPLHLTRDKKGRLLTKTPSDQGQEAYARQQATYQKALAAWEGRVKQGEEARKRLREEARLWAIGRVQARLSALKAPADAPLKGEIPSARLRMDGAKGQATIHLDRAVDPGLLKADPVREAQVLRAALEGLKELVSGRSPRRKVRRG